VKEDNTPIDITGQTLLFTVKKKTGGNDSDSDALISKTITTHSDPTNGITELTLTDADTNVAPGEYPFDFKRIDSGSVIGYDSGTLTIVETVTQRSS
jgi:hypothetical protein